MSETETRLRPSPAFAFLGLEAGADARAVKRAYAARLKLTHPEDDAEGFQQLHAAYQRALLEVRWAEEQCAEDAAVERDPEPQPSDPGSTPVEPVVVVDAPELDRRPRGDDLQSGNVAFDPPALSPPTDPVALVEALQQLLRSEGEAAALAAFDGLLHGEALIAFDTRDHFQWLALEAFTTLSPRPLRLLDRLVRAFDWNDHQHPLQQAHAMQAALEAHHAVQAREYLQELAAGRRQSAKPTQKVAARLLLDTEGGFLHRANLFNVRDSDDFRRLLVALHARYGAGWSGTLAPHVLKACRLDAPVAPRPGVVLTTLAMPLRVYAVLATVSVWIGLGLIARLLLGGFGVAIDDLSPGVAIGSVLGALVVSWLVAKQWLYRPYERFGGWLQRQHHRAVAFMQTRSGRRLLLSAVAASTLLMALPQGWLPLAPWLVIPAMFLLWALRFGSESVVLSLVFMAMALWPGSGILLKLTGLLDGRPALSLMLALHGASAVFWGLLSRRIDGKPAYYATLGFGFVLLLVAFGIEHSLRP